MYASMWSYPWDLVDCGIEQSLDDMQENGLTGVSMITSYHAGRFLQIRSPKRMVYFPEDGVMYYPSDLSRFKGQLIQPKVGRYIKEHPDFWDKLFDAAAKRNMTVSGWTVCLHNTRIGMNYPEVTVHNAFDDAVYYNLCPSNPHVREYMCTLAEDISSSLSLYSMELESMNYMGHAHEFHHEKDGIGLTSLQDFLLSLCFCPSCVERAKKAGIDILPAKHTVKSWLNEMCKQDQPPKNDAEFLEKGIEYFKEYQDVYTYLKWRSTVVTSLMEEVHTAVHGRCKLYFLSLLPHSQSWLFGVDLNKISNLCEGAVICSYDCDAQKARGDLQESTSGLNKKADILVGMRCFMPEYKDFDEFNAKIKATKEFPIKGYLMYNYGLIPPSHLAWIKKALY